MSKRQFCRYATTLILSICLIPFSAYSQIIDKVIAYVDDYAITMYDLEEAKKGFKDNRIDIDTDDIVNSIINKVLLRKEAKKMRLDSSETKDPINEYIDIKIRSLIFIKEEDIQRFYNENRGSFGDLPISSVKDNIEHYLTEQEVNKQLKKHLSELRKRSNIVVNTKIGQSD
ncbi:MAG: hypothetical protein N3A62_03245 [Thermodesulfovibrionales bacterium]|nr:hypothetical protein [Thermodesulfovibrionales bacterium]